MGVGSKVAHQLDMSPASLARLCLASAAPPKICTGPLGQLHVTAGIDCTSAKHKGAQAAGGAPAWTPGRLHPVLLHPAASICLVRQCRGRLSGSLLLESLRSVPSVLQPQTP